MQKSVLALVTLTTPEGCFLGTTAGRELASKTTESLPPLEGALFSLESINLCFLYPTYLLLILFLHLCDESMQSRDNSNSNRMSAEYHLIKHTMDTFPQL